MFYPLCSIYSNISHVASLVGSSDIIFKADTRDDNHDTTQLWFKLAQWFQRRRFLKEFRTTDRQTPSDVKSSHNPHIILCVRWANKSYLLTSWSNRLIIIFCNYFVDVRSTYKWYVLIQRVQKGGLSLSSQLDYCCQLCAICTTFLAIDWIPDHHCLFFKTALNQGPFWLENKITENQWKLAETISTHPPLAFQIVYFWPVLTVSINIW